MNLSCFLEFHDLLCCLKITATTISSDIGKTIVNIKEKQNIELNPPVTKECVVVR